MANRWIVAFLILALLVSKWVGGGTPASADTASAASEEGLFPYAAIDRMARASVPIACATDVQGKIGIRNINGSGFFVNRRGDVVTAQHVVAALGGCIPGNLCATLCMVFYQRKRQRKVVSDLIVRPGCRPRHRGLPPRRQSVHRPYTPHDLGDRSVRHRDEAGRDSRRIYEFRSQQRASNHIGRHRSRLFLGEPPALSLSR